MALVWQTRTEGNHYKVTRAGQSLRLYRNGVFHTQYHPERIITGDIWELMLLAALHLAPQRFGQHPQALLLGAGGGAVINLLRHFIEPAHTDVVDLDATMLRLCEDYFLTSQDKLTLHHADAGQWLGEAMQAQPPAYDLVIDDLFGEHEGQPIKAFDFDSPWFNKLKSVLSRQGSLVMNFESSAQLSASPLIQDSGELQRAGFRSMLRFSSPRYQNVILLLSRQALSSRQFRQWIDEDRLLRKQRLGYYVRQMAFS